MAKLSKITVDFVNEDMSIRKIESSYLKQVLSLCLSLLKFVINQKVNQNSQKRPIKESDEKLKHSGNRARRYLSLFGLLKFTRPSFSSNKRGMLYLVDELLDMPKGLWSYNLQELTSANATQTNFRESVTTLNKLLDLGLSSTGSERNINHLGAQVEVYYQQKPKESLKTEVCFSASFDGKGVPKIKPRKVGHTKEIKRLGKGEKRGVKQMATVGVMSYFEPKTRSVASIIRGLMEYSSKKEKTDQQLQSKEKNDNRWHQGIHRRAFLADQDKCIDYGIGYIKSMMQNPNSRFVVPIDAGIGLEDKVLKYVKKHELESQFAGIILDIIHVSEYTWDCANAVLGEGSKLRTAWVREMLEDLLNSKTTKVIKDLEQIVAKGNLTKSKVDKIQKAITYFTNHQHKMDYKFFLEKGYPISSALVESNCGHLVKDRMELSGMRWSSKGAQNMLDMRAVKLNGDLEDFINYTARKSRKIIIANAA